MSADIRQDAMTLLQATALVFPETIAIRQQVRTNFCDSGEE
jgi:hypothetical protein